jgi:hypothetical protein
MRWRTPSPLRRSDGGAVDGEDQIAGEQSGARSGRSARSSAIRGGVTRQSKPRPSVEG